MTRVQDQNINHEVEQSAPVSDQQVPDFFMAKPKRKGIKLGNKSSEIVRHAGHIMPFPVAVAYQSFSDFSRHAEWDPNTESATYMDAQRGIVRWTRKVMGFSIGWTTKTTVKELNKSLAWKSIEGVKMENRVIFQPVDEGRGTMMIMSTSYKVPEKVFVPSRKMVGKKNKNLRASSHTVESERVMEILESFCKVVMKDLAEKQKREERDAMYFL